MRSFFGSTPASPAANDRPRRSASFFQSRSSGCQPSFAFGTFGSALSSRARPTKRMWPGRNLANTTAVISSVAATGLVVDDGVAAALEAVHAVDARVECHPAEDDRPLLLGGNDRERRPLF